MVWIFPCFKAGPALGPSTSGSWDACGVSWHSADPEIHQNPNENWERIEKYVNDCKYIYIYVYVHTYLWFMNEIHWNPFSKQEGWVLVYITMKVLVFSSPCFLQSANRSIRLGFVTWSWRMELLPCFTRQVGGWTCCAGNQNLSQSMGRWLGSLNVNPLTCPI